MTATDTVPPADEQQSGPAPAPPADGRNVAVLAERLALPAAWLVLIVIYGITTPATFLSWSNVTNILGSQAVLLMLALAALMPSLVGDFDLSLGGIMGMTATVIAVLNIQFDMPIGLACAVGLLVAVVAGVLNGFLVVVADTNPLIVTLGTGSVFTGVVSFLTQNNTLLGIDRALSPRTFTTKLNGIPFDVTSFTPLGLRTLFVGQSREVARLSGIRVARIRMGGFILGGFIAGIAGLLFLGTTGAADPTATGPYLLPA